MGKLTKDQIEVLKKYRSLAKSIGQFPTFLDLETVDVSRGVIRSRFGSLGKLAKVLSQEHPKEYKGLLDAEEKGKTKNVMMAKHAELILDYSRYLTRKELTDQGVSVFCVDEIFGGLSNFIEATKKAHPDTFESLVTDQMFTPEKFKLLKKEVDKYDRFVITTAVAGCTVDKEALASLKNYCDKEDALLLFLPNADPAHNRAGLSTNLMFDRVLADENFVYRDLRLNSNFMISGLQLQAKQINPGTGLSRLGRGSMVYGSPKMSLEPISGELYPRYIMSPGGITESDYTTENYASQRTAYLANHDHVMGALVVEIVDNKKYFFRQLQFGASGDFYDLGKEYGPDYVKTAPIPDIVLGDIQFPDYDKEAVKCWKKLLKDIPVNHAIVHDVRDAIPEALWDRKKNITMALKAHEFTIDIGSDLNDLVSFLNDLGEYPIKGLKVVKSNHDEMLDRFIESGDYVCDKINFEVGHELALTMFRGQKKDQYFDLLGSALKDRGLSERIKFLRRNDRYRIGGVECGKHGDIGPGGRYSPSLGALEKAYKNMVIGHKHAQQILRGIWVVGTSGNKDPRWRRGPTGWTATSCHVYPDGRRQLVTCIDGEYRQ